MPNLCKVFIQSFTQQKYAVIVFYYCGDSKNQKEKNISAPHGAYISVQRDIDKLISYMIG